ncbi:rCG28012 [Rattus norvegicus]|uniref:RCG28012 n=1 Tax=Rattus norvegicus TaxID=10116 RepID=A6IEJ7_RAT|nr:rCG28012 [Rattus norvegicus]
MQHDQLPPAPVTRPYLRWWIDTSYELKIIPPFHELILLGILLHNKRSNLVHLSL